GLPRRRPARRRAAGRGRSAPRVRRRARAPPPARGRRGRGRGTGPCPSVAAGRGPVPPASVAQVTQLLDLRLEVAAVVLVLAHGQRHALLDGEAEAVQGSDLAWVVRE